MPRWEVLLLGLFLLFVYLDVWLSLYTWPSTRCYIHWLFWLCNKSVVFKQKYLSFLNFWPLISQIKISEITHYKSCHKSFDIRSGTFRSQFPILPSCNTAECALCVLRSGSLAATPFMREFQNPALCVPTSLYHGLPLENLRPSNPDNIKRSTFHSIKRSLKLWNRWPTEVLKMVISFFSLHFSWTQEDAVPQVPSLYKAGCHCSHEITTPHMLPCMKWHWVDLPRTQTLSGV